jgi:hypothetical protein
MPAKTEKKSSYPKDNDRKANAADIQLESAFYPCNVEDWSESIEKFGAFVSFSNLCMNLDLINTPYCKISSPRCKLSYHCRIPAIDDMENF